MLRLIFLGYTLGYTAFNCHNIATNPQHLYQQLELSGRHEVFSAD